jgi:alpha-tubulin suppressor-like RCC1 family protein
MKRLLAGVAQQARSFEYVPPEFRYLWFTGAHGTLLSGINVGTGTTLPMKPSTVEDLDDWQIVVLMTEAALALRDGVIYGTGYNNVGQLGRGNTTSPQTTWVQTVATTGWDYLAANRFGFNQSAHGIKSGDLYGWGSNYSYVLGDNTQTQRNAPWHINWGGILSGGWQKVSTGQQHALGIRDGKLYAWGSDLHGRTGRGKVSGTTNTPAQVGTATDWSHVAAGYSHSLGIRDGKLFAWGQGFYYATGLAVQANQTSPAQVGSDTDWTHVAAGQDFSCGIRGGRLYTWGRSNYYQTGQDTTANVQTPQQIGSDTDWTHVDVGVNHALAIKGGRLFGWGLASSYRTGVDTAETYLTVPTQAGSGTDWVMATGGEVASYGIRKS